MRDAPPGLLFPFFFLWTLSQSSGYSTLYPSYKVCFARRILLPYLFFFAHSPLSVGPFGSPRCCMNLVLKSQPLIGHDLLCDGHVFGTRLRRSGRTRQHTSEFGHRPAIQFSFNKIQRAKRNRNGETTQPERGSGRCGHSARAMFILCSRQWTILKRKGALISTSTLCGYCFSMFYHE